MSELIEKRIKALMPNVDFCSVRYHLDRQDAVHIRQNILQPSGFSDNEGVMITIHNHGGIGYAATADLSESGLKEAIKEAMNWADRTAGRAVLDFSSLQMPTFVGSYESVVEQPWLKTPLTEKIDRLMAVSESLKSHASIVDWAVVLMGLSEYRLYLTNHGGRVEQQCYYLAPYMSASANKGSETVRRSYSKCNQGGLELLHRFDFDHAGISIAEEAVALLAAPNCPEGKMDILLDPDQMVLQIHESIGHPLELDRILGDERNYAGTSFVNMDMFGAYQYGSDLLNITFDPSDQSQVASYGFDDEGLKAEKTYIIRDGLLLNPLGGAISQARAEGSSGVACGRAVCWTRPAIDRMANLNLEIGNSKFEDMVASIEDGVYMKTNSSWSIDDSRNKFQFGCEWGQRIENGKLTHLVKKPNYRGISANFWRSLKMVGDKQTREVLGTLYCGKGEPNQAIKVGHATPACVFSNVDIFGGD
ncbi:MAG: TldD/PmbA family protein [Bdellovibrionota bacterium]